ncbi:hypothetical protein ACFYQ5_04010 [Streptomyces sp. NPDC005794]|uniref:hypothetical protein n=1 Tax=Streptomyces sp. NPDC005794 TaxID=3364733 RepID=UPI0036967FE3
MADNGGIDCCVRRESDAVDQENIHIHRHEVGHIFGLADFYDWTPTGRCCLLMKAGAATQIAKFHTWTLRDLWRRPCPGSPLPGPRQPFPWRLPLNSDDSSTNS